MDVARDRRIRIYLGQPARGYLRFLVESLQPLAMLVGEDGQGGFVEARFGPEQPLFLEDRLDAWLSALDERGEALVLSTCGMGPWKPGWQGCYSGMRVGGFFVRPPWAPCRPELLDLVIDPGGGCGCGLHPTVQVCLGELEA
ncbi:MAG: hypothetical protein FJ125_03580, partial [Deltaproteobacteria bacterium]|nr:hypothetical protein [Deltaproteobacteria bacterium]